MSDRASNRSGSALLIVLGFLSFMVVSAIGFAVFMRSERAPSSALRRSVATRHLVKAALARAISAVDDAVRADAFPHTFPANLQSEAEAQEWMTALNSQYQNGYQDVNGNLMDVWQGRVFMPPDPEGGTVPNDVKTRFAPISETVSVLTLEALGYLPPPLVNDVRFLSRCTWSAKWQNLPYDSGRCAYVAVNVSDFFDITRLHANSGRNSSDDGRISLAALFRDSGGNLNDQAAQNFERLVHHENNGSPSRVEDRDEGASATATMPYVSLLDYNLALGAKYNVSGLGDRGDGLGSPFFNWLENSGQRYFYVGTGTNDAEVVGARQQPFVTDSWFPRADGGDSSLTNLFFEDTQPFKAQTIDKGWKAGFDEVSGVTRNFTTRVIDANEDLFESDRDLLSLFDYLDRDDVPLSLAIPSVERIPMATALSPVVNGQLLVHVEKKYEEQPAAHQKQPYDKITTYTVTFKDLPKANLQAVFSFPFKHGADITEPFSQRALMRLFFMAAPPDADPAKSMVNLRNGGRADNNANFFACMRPDWDEWSRCEPFSLLRGDKKAFILNYLSPKDSLEKPDLKRKSYSQEDAFMDGDGTKISAQPQGSVNGKTFFVVTTVQHVNAQDVEEGEPQTTWTFPDDCRPLLDGETVLPDAPGDTYKDYVLTPYVATWVKVTRDGGNERVVVDYVPAMGADDKDIRNWDPAKGHLDMLTRELGMGDEKGVPMLAVRYDQPVTLGSILDTASAQITDKTGGADVPLVDFQAGSWKPRGYYAVDPRYNWAPEDWIPSDKVADPDEWLKMIKDILGDGEQGRMNDIFLSVSNQGYLQSMGELAMLPMGKAGAVDYKGDALSVGANNMADAAHAAHFWRNYPIGYEADAGRYNMFKLGICTDGKGFRVNPHTDSLDVMRTVVDFTPCDWWAAGTNTVPPVSDDNKLSVSEKKKIMTDASTAKDYAFCENNPSAKLTGKAALGIAQALMSAFRDQPDWEAAYDALWRKADDVDFDEGSKCYRKLFDVDLDGLELSDSDRKFLYAFWRDCFANKQQLFLIFVRAESNALGGPGEGTPSQQGGRAVALVWRDPKMQPGATDNRDNSTRQDEYRQPHRTRVLFYHQFE